MQKYLDDADKIWEEVKTREKIDLEYASLSSEQKVRYYQKENPEFTNLFPIVLRYMVQFLQYSRKALQRHIERLKSHPYRSKLEYCRRQADYIKYLYLETVESPTKTEANKIWRSTYETLEKEVIAFEKAEDIIKQNLEKNSTKNNIDRREELKKILENSN